MLIAAAYGDGPPLAQNRMVLNARWIGGAGGGHATADRFDIVAKADGTLSDGQFRNALRMLLADRFKLVVHHESRELPIYALIMDRADRRLGPRLKRSDVDCTDPREYTAKNADGTSKCGFRTVSGKASGRQTMGILTRLFTNAVADHRLVEDRTGLEGTYDFELEFTAAREQLGLRLEPGKTSVDILVVDRAEHPTEA